MAEGAVLKCRDHCILANADGLTNILGLVSYVQVLGIQYYLFKIFSSQDEITS